MEYKWFAWILLLAYMIVDMYVTRVLAQWHQRTWPQAESTFFSGWSLSREYQYQFAGSYTIVCTSNMEVPSTKQNGSQCFAEKLLTCSESLRPGAERKYMEEVLCSLFSSPQALVLITFLYSRRQRKHMDGCIIVWRVCGIREARRPNMRTSKIFRTSAKQRKRKIKWLYGYYDPRWIAWSVCTKSLYGSDTSRGGSLW